MAFEPAFALACLPEGAALGVCTSDEPVPELFPEETALLSFCFRARVVRHQAHHQLRVTLVTQVARSVQRMEARKGGDVFGSVHDSPVAEGDAPKQL